MDIADLQITPANPSSPIPLYFQVESDLRRLIEEGVLESGATVPPEQDLARFYGVSRQTIRQALGRLVADDLVTRGAGRGTFVKSPPDRTQFYLDRSFTQQMAEMGLQAHSIILEQDIGTIGVSYPPILQGHVGDACLHLTRLRFADAMPVGLQHATLLLTRCPGLEQYDFAQRSLFEVLSTEYNLVITAIQHTIAAAVADARQAELLEVVVGDPLLVVKTATFLEDNQLIEFTVSHYRADRYEYRTTHRL